MTCDHITVLSHARVCTNLRCNTVIRQYWHKIRHMTNGTEQSPEINPCTYGQLIYLTTEEPRPYNGERAVSSELDSHVQKNEIRLLSHTSQTPTQSRGKT